MSSYESFASVYDLYMDEVPYDTWCDNICSLLRHYGINSGLVADLGCGTGAMTRRLADAGYTLLGVDLSPDMLTIAADRSYDGGQAITYICQDICHLQLGTKADAMVSLCDCLNYLVEDGSLHQALRAAAANLASGGLLIFDMNTPYKYETLLADNVFTETREEGSFIWENEYDLATRLNTYYLTLYVVEDDNPDLFTRTFEEHYQRAYDINEVTSAIQAAGLQLDQILDVDTMTDPQAVTERWYFVCKK